MFFCACILFNYLLRYVVSGVSEGDRASTASSRSCGVSVFGAHIALCAMFLCFTLFVTVLCCTSPCSSFAPQITTSPALRRCLTRCGQSMAPFCSATVVTIGTSSRRLTAWRGLKSKSCALWVSVTVQNLSSTLQSRYVFFHQGYARNIPISHTAYYIYATRWNRWCVVVMSLDGCLGLLRS